MLLWTSEDMDFWKIESDEDIVTVKWSHNYFEDYKILSYQFFECGNRTFDEVIEDVNDNIKELLILVQYFDELKRYLARTTYQIL